ncbi:MAG: RidA family protein [Gammaproteobacteria bacterium]|nr:RidA family protein [Gammaproteobacteria bacterium]
MSKQVISTQQAPAAIGPYSQAVRVGNLVFLSGQIPLVPETMELISDDITEQARQMFKNLQAVAVAAGGSLDDLVKVNIYLTDIDNFQAVNQVMESFFTTPYPARAAVGVAQLPRGAAVEIEAIMAAPER